MSTDSPNTRPGFRLREKLRSNLPLARLDHELKLAPHEVLLVGDGSGTGDWSIGAGWGCAVVSRLNSYRTLVSGGWSRGSVMLAELSAYLQGLMTYEHDQGAFTRKSLGKTINVQVLTDNMGVCQQYVSAFSGRFVGGDCGPIWAAIREVSRAGNYTLNFRHIPRLSLILNNVCDKVAYSARKTVEDTVSPETLEAKFHGSLDGWNP